MKMEIEMIDKYLKRNGLTNTEFARRIGYNRVSWQKIKSGIVPMSEQFISNVERIFPDIFLPSKATYVANYLTVSHPAPTAQPSLFYRLVDKLYVWINKGRIIDPDARER
jgi:hypothetical protein